MKSFTIKSFADYIEKFDGLSADKTDILLYRGQSVDKPLLPTIAREDNALDTTSVEQQMLEELKRKSNLLFAKNIGDDWDWLVYGQHFGLKTRLLDWTTNPLAALWFACSGNPTGDEDCYVYLLSSDKTLLLDREELESPFSYTKTKVFKPNLNNERIVAQAGWFTAHSYSRPTKKFVSLETNKDIRSKLRKFIIPFDLKQDLLKKLNTMGINSYSLFPDITGACKQINWEFSDK
jgi:hypothetical protein